MSEFSFSAGVLPILYKSFIIGIYYKNPSPYIFAHKKSGRLETENKYNKNINGVRKKERFENYTNLKVDIEAPFPHLKVGYGSKDTSR